MVVRSSSLFLRYFLYTISHPGRSGIPGIDLSRDKDANPLNASPQPAQVKLDRVLTKAVSQCSHFKPIINDRLRSALKVKLWRMGKALFRLNSRQRKVLQEKWKQHQWTLELKPSEIQSSLLQENSLLKRKLEQNGDEMARLKSEIALGKQAFRKQQSLTKSPTHSKSSPLGKRKAR